MSVYKLTDINFSQFMYWLLNAIRQFMYRINFISIQIDWYQFQSVYVLAIEWYPSVYVPTKLISASLCTGWYYKLTVTYTLEFHAWFPMSVVFHFWQLKIQVNITRWVGVLKFAFLFMFSALKMSKEVGTWMVKKEMNYFNLVIQCLRKVSNSGGAKYWKFHENGQLVPFLGKIRWNHMFLEIPGGANAPCCPATQALWFDDPLPEGERK